MKKKKVNARAIRQRSKYSQEIKNSPYGFLIDVKLTPQEEIQILTPYSLYLYDLFKGDGSMSHFN